MSRYIPRRIGDIKGAFVDLVLLEVFILQPIHIVPFFEQIQVSFTHTHIAPFINKAQSEIKS